MACFRHVQLVYDLESLKSLKSPMVVMCTSGALEFGFARRLFVEWAANENNALVRERTMKIERKERKRKKERRESERG